MKQILIGMALLVMTLGLATVMHASADENEFEGGSSEFNKVPTYTESEIQKKIQDEMAVACEGNMCKIVGTDNQGSSWTVSFSVGYGSNNGNLGGSGTGVYIYDPSQSNSDPNWYGGITITYKWFKCKSHLNVTPAVYRFVNTYLYNMVNSDGSVKRNFSPADQTVILFYTTMLNKVEQCKSSL